MKNTITKGLAESISYDGYRSMVTTLLSENKSTGHGQSEALTHYSRMNETRMNRLEKTVLISEKNASAMQSLASRFTWLVISEGWCGDAAQILPVLEKLAKLSDKVTLKIVLRDEHPELMDLFLTHNTRSIPKLIVLDENNAVKTTWGPRPKAALDLVADYKRENGVFDDAGKTALQLWYTKDKGASIQDEMVAIMAGL
ncbi:thioredoxin family protein [Flavobacterium pallidum]|uniref:Thioredoxin family protein n=1 Tax=Flavobacterium pallidum TaxID=2172098 RepID=A0A2S1SEM1_9FLAO|nr:thioredoxin family protein [Flavobacterium pallidum]AWI24802.1 thioredoxin family protein [Flavobacterium pallidum]